MASSTPVRALGRPARHPTGRRAPVWTWGWLLGWILLLCCACGSADDPGNDPAQETATESPRPSARPELMETLRRDLAEPRHASDGAGRAWLEPEQDGSAPRAQAGRPGRWTIHFEAGPLGVAEGGTVYLQVSPFWGWSTPQNERPGAVGYTSVATSADVELEIATLDQQLLGITLRRGRLAPGDRLTLEYGAGSAGAVADRFAEEASRFWIAVDGDGDGIRKVLADSPSIVVEPGPAARLVAHLPSTARPGETVRLRLAVLDGRGSAGVDVEGTVQLQVVEGAELLELPSRWSLPAAARGVTEITARTLGSGLVRVAAQIDLPGGRLETVANPLQISERGVRILWGDLQNHSGDSDGTGEPEELYHYARDVAALDVFALTDHDHWGMLFLDQRPEQWRHLEALAARYNDPGSFVALLGFEWTHWVYGHRHVLYFEPTGPLLSSLDPATDTPEELWQALRGRRAITVAHHSAGGPVATDWSIPPDPELEPITEIVSVHGVSEAADSPSLIHRPVPGNFVRDALAKGYRFGFVGSSDGHDGHPGLAHLASPTGGVVAILAEERTREAVYAALRARRVYATSGPRVILRTTLGGVPMGSEVPVADGRPVGESPIAGIPRDTLVVQAVAPSPLETLEIVRSGAVIERLDCAGQPTCGYARKWDDLEPGDYLYVRLTQVDGGLTWSSPFYCVPAPPSGQRSDLPSS